MPVGMELCQARSKVESDSRGNPVSTPAVDGTGAFPPVVQHSAMHAQTSDLPYVTNDLTCEACLQETALSAAVVPPTPPTCLQYCHPTPFVFLPVTLSCVKVSLWSVLRLLLSPL